MLDLRYRPGAMKLKEGSQKLACDLFHVHCSTPYYGIRSKISERVSDFIYGESLEAVHQTRRGSAITWIHIPANNVRLLV